MARSIRYRSPLSGRAAGCISTRPSPAKRWSVCAGTPRVSLCCIGDTNRGAFGNFTTEYESAILRGQAAEVTDPEEKQRILRLLCERHTPELMEKFPSEAARSLGRTGVWCIETETITAKRKRYDSAGVELKYQREE